MCVLQLAHVALAFQGFGWTSKYQVPLLLAQTILGSWDKSRSVDTHALSCLRPWGDSRPWLAETLCDHQL